MTENMAEEESAESMGRRPTEPRTEAGRILLRRCESGGWITWDHQPVRLNGMRRAILAIEAEAAQGD